MAFLHFLGVEMKVTVHGTDTIVQVLDRLQQVNAAQVPFATSLALNRLAEKIRAGEKAVMRARFDRPTPYTMNSLYMRPATKSRLMAEVKIKDGATKAVAPVNWLAAEITGGARRQKRSEVALSSVGIAKAWEPAPGATRDGYGNVSRALIVKMLSALRAFGEQGYTANRSRSKRSAKKARAFDIFVGAPNGEPSGVWQRVAMAHGTALKPLMWLHDELPTYRVRVPFDKIAANIYTAHAPREFERAMREALATAR